ncbi:LacI family transcriptional regulator [Vibrio sp. qd031]|uniref:LacI family DNA-binding transcriptional regulator n=1 Tax=Vibrio sp. qd031 TaxID=1603038 RepID=UPI000A0F6784|nr:substrate-binding domain-containing protein [Vibrio sp. qd031]ORT49631.1 LacI family transcriptional regulator [Vibrio sp. qd031]
MARTKTSASVYDVAKLAGVSVSTVSRFLNRSSFVSDDKAQKIEQAIIDSGYKPKYQMQVNTARRSMTIGVLVQHPDSPFTSRILNDMEKTLIAQGYSLVIASGHWRSSLEEHALDYLLRSNVDGIIVVTGNLEKQKIVRMAQSIPMVTLGYDIEAPNVHSLQLDNELGGYMATLHLMQQGHVNIAHIKGLHSQPDSGARYQGYKRALSEADIEINPKLVKEGDFSCEQGYEQTLKLIDSNIHFSAIFAANDLTAYGAIKALHDRDIRVPEDVSVIGFDDLPTSQYFTPALTTLRQPVEELGELCANTILNHLSGDRLDERLPPIDLIVRQSTKSLYR